MSGLEAIKYEKKTLQDRVKSFKDAIFGDLRMIQKMATGKTSELTPEWKAIPPSSPISTSQASTPTALRSSPSEWTELEIEHKKLDRWTAALGDQMLSQCYAAARLLKGTAAIAAVRRCSARVERRAQRYLHTKLLGDSDSQSGDDAMAGPDAAAAGPVFPGRLPGDHAAMTSGRRPAADLARAAAGEGGHGLWAGAGRRSGSGRRAGGRRAGPRFLKQYAPTAIEQITPTHDTKVPEPSAPKSGTFEDPGSGHGGRWGRGGNGLQPGRNDPKVEHLREAGIHMNDWPRESTPHEWGPDGRDHYNSSRVEAQAAEHKFFYSHAERPYWAFINHALRSQPLFANPEGEANMHLMRGSMYMPDEWHNNTNREPPHRSAEDGDHFGHWPHSSGMNVRLLYGRSPIFNGRLPPDTKGSNSSKTPGSKPAGFAAPVGRRNPWSLGDVVVNLTKALKNATEIKKLIEDDGFPERKVKCWGTNRCCKPEDLIEAGKLMEEVGRPLLMDNQPLLIAALGRSALNANQTVVSEGRLRLERKGVNVDGFKFK
jgi:hypothetical protein